MDTNTLQILDYYRVRNQVAGYCKSAEAKNILENWLPLTDFNLIQERKNKGLEWQLFINSCRNPFTKRLNCDILLDVLIEII